MQPAIYTHSSAHSNALVVLPDAPARDRRFSRTAEEEFRRGAILTKYFRCQVRINSNRHVQLSKRTEFRGQVSLTNVRRTIPSGCFCSESELRCTCTSSSLDTASDFVTCREFRADYMGVELEGTRWWVMPSLGKQCTIVPQTGLPPADVCMRFLPVTTTARLVMRVRMPGPQAQSLGTGPAIFAHLPQGLGHSCIAYALLALLRTTPCNQ